MEFLQAERKQSASGVWKGLLRTHSTVELGRYLLVGSGSSISTWKDPWVLGLPFRPTPHPSLVTLDAKSRVAHLIVLPLGYGTSNF